MDIARGQKKSVEPTGSDISRCLNQDDTPLDTAMLDEWKVHVGGHGFLKTGRAPGQILGSVSAQTTPISSRRPPLQHPSVSKASPLKFTLNLSAPKPPQPQSQQQPAQPQSSDHQHHTSAASSPLSTPPKSPVFPTLELFQAGFYALPSTGKPPPAEIHEKLDKEAPQSGDVEMTDAKQSQQQQLAPPDQPYKYRVVTNSDYSPFPHVALDGRHLDS